jgi:hypothetical protein
MDVDAIASRMGRAVDRVHPVFRLGAVLLLCASLLLVAQNALILTTTVAVATGGSLNLNAPEDPSGATPCPSPRPST